MSTSHPSRSALGAVVLAVMLPLTACSQDNPAADEGTEVVGGNAAPDEAVTEDITITALKLAFPEDGIWEEGEDVPLYAAIANSGRTADRLVEVRGGDFEDAQLVGHDGTEGAIEVREDDNLYLEPDGPPSVLLLGIGTSLRSAQAIPITFVFEEAGEVTMEATVAPSSPAEGSFTTPQDPTSED
jgi:copper(I)-binding protein